MFAEWVCLHPDPTYSQTLPHSEGLGTRFLPESPPLGLIGKQGCCFRGWRMEQLTLSYSRSSNQGRGGQHHPSTPSIPDLSAAIPPTHTLFSQSPWQTSPMDHSTRAEPRSFSALIRAGAEEELSYARDRYTA